MDAPMPDESPAQWKRLPSWLLTQTAAHAHRLVSDAFAAAGARGYHYRVLATLAEFGPASQADLGRRTAIHLSDMVGSINELTRQGLVERSPDPADRRRNIISLTAAGQRSLKLMHAQLIRGQDELLAPLSNGERGQLAELLGRLLDHHGRKE